MNTEKASEGRVEKAAILKAASALGVLGGSAQTGRRLLAMLCNPETTAADVARAIDSEPGMAARVLRVANSAFYGLTRKVSTLDRALMLLGLDAVRGIAAAACLDRAVPQGKDVPPIDVLSLLRHSVAVAATAQELAKLRKPGLAAEAFIAGLLHDYGVLVQLRVDPAGLQQFLKLLQVNAGGTASDMEKECVAATHAHCASVVFEEWKLPASLVAAVRYHHRPERAPEPDAEMVALVHIADHVSRVSGIGFVYEPEAERAGHAAMARLGVTEEVLKLLVVGLPERVDELQQSLSSA